ncbi:MAG: trypsin-like peptidase domain-containing protein [Verrucomicrobiota bacterium]
MHIQRLCGLGLGLVLVASLGAAETEPEKSVVQIFTSSQQPMWDAPWRSQPVQRAGGTGFVIAGKRIMSNAHVVSWARQILVRRYQDPKPYEARVEFVGHDCDLVLLKVEDESFFDGLEPLGFGTLPKVRTAVTTYGYPAGGEQISYTRGVVSRIEVQTYAHIGNRAFVAVQTDAAINPGNSGGPVIQDGRVVGVAFQGMQGLENTGFFISPPVIQHFLKDIADGKYDGYPMAGIRPLPLHNPAQRRALKVPERSSVGCRVDSLVHGTSAQSLLQEDDVLLQVGAYEVGSDCTIVYQGNRMNLAAAFQEVQHGETLPLKVWRKGKGVDIQMPVKMYEKDKSAGNQYDVLPRYFVYGGLVFTPLSLDYLKTFGQNWSDAASAELIYELFYRPHETPESARPEPVVLSGVLSAPVNANFGVKGRLLVDKINGMRIEKLDDVVRAFQAGQGAQHTLEFLPRGTFECLDRQAADAANAAILKTYNLPKDRRL